MSSNTQFKEYNKRLKAQIRSLTKTNEDLLHALKSARQQIILLSNALEKCKKKKTNWFHRLFNKK